MNISLNGSELALKYLLAAPPFPWQLALLDAMLAGRLPGALDVPTGLGKTAVMGIWLVARAFGAPVPRRLIYVVDRRAVVDQATAVAERLRLAIERDDALRERLDLDGPLPISTLRGQFIDNRSWLADPASPAIVLGTIDMVGSRLLFEGYGVSRKMRPYHAGLLGADSLIVLDEAHLVPPFERMLETVVGSTMLRPASDIEALIPRLRLLSLSATGKTRNDALTLSAADRRHPVVARRLAASKHVVLRDEVAAKDLPERLVDEAWALSDAGARPVRCIVFCNRRDDAQKVRQGLVERAGNGAEEQIDTELFVGGRRIHEREEAARWLGERGFLAGTEGAPTKPTFVVATSAGEVGVDLDADHMVSDLVAWERMVQRLGRVNRRGGGEASVIVVPALPDKPADGELDRLHAVRELLEELPRRGNALDGSPGAITALKARAHEDPALARRISVATTPDVLHPPLTRALVESWSMTSLEEHTGRPEVAPWLRGWIDDEDPQTTLVWRVHLPVTDTGRLLNARDLAAFREAADPHLAERLETETWRVLDWLGKRLGNLKTGTEAAEGRLTPLRNHDVAAVLLDGRAAPRTLTAQDLSNKDRRATLEWELAGALILVDVRVGGLTGGLLDETQSEPVLDVTTVEASPPRERVVPFRVRETTTDVVANPQWRTELLVPVAFGDEGDETKWLVVESVAGESASSENGRAIAARRAQRLDEHEEWAEHMAARIARRLGLPLPYAELLTLAARLHDEGKRSSRWQRAFGVSGDDLKNGVVYGKTTSRPNLALLDGYRHELGSLPHAEAHSKVKALDPPLRDLCLHLIAAHHGNARPLIRTDGADAPPSVLQERAQEIALRFARLEKRWGPWGLAWWEALLRAADQQASRLNDQPEREAPHG